MLLGWAGSYASWRRMNPDERLTEGPSARGSIKYSTSSEPTAPSKTSTEKIGQSCHLVTRIASPPLLYDSQVIDTLEVAATHRSGIIQRSKTQRMLQRNWNLLVIVI